MSDHCAQCNKIRALPDSPTRRDMTLDHLLELGHQARLVEWQQGGHVQYPAKPPESDAQALIEQVLANPSDYLDSDDEEPLFRVFRTLKSLIEADAQRLKEMELARNSYQGELHRATERAEKAERERDEYKGWLVRSETELAAVKGRLAELIQYIRKFIKDHNYRVSEYFIERLIEACAKAEAGEPVPSAELGQIDTGLIEILNRTIDELRVDRLKWIKVCAERDNRIVELCNLMRRIKDYARQHTQYPFAFAIVDLCNQVLEPKGNEHQAS